MQASQVSVSIGDQTTDPAFEAFAGANRGADVLTVTTYNLLAPVWVSPGIYPGQDPALLDPPPRRAAGGARARVDGWAESHRYPSATHTRTLGRVGEPAAENEAILHEHGISTQPFPAEALAGLPPADWSIPAAELARRLDLRHHGDADAEAPICSIDPPGCVDIDDAMHARQLGPGRYEVGVHIADVCHFIQPGSALDQEAAKRGNTFYLVASRVNMVPERLSEGLA